MLPGYLEEAASRVAPYLEADLLQELHQLVDPQSRQHLLDQPHLTMTWLNVLAFGQKSVLRERGGREGLPGGAARLRCGSRWPTP